MMRQKFVVSIFEFCSPKNVKLESHALGFAGHVVLLKMLLANILRYSINYFSIYRSLSYIGNNDVKYSMGKAKKLLQLNLLYRLKKSQTHPFMSMARSMEITNIFLPNFIKT